MPGRGGNRSCRVTSVALRMTPCSTPWRCASDGIGSAVFWRPSGSGQGVPEPRVEGTIDPMDSRGGNPYHIAASITRLILYPKQLTTFSLVFETVWNVPSKYFNSIKLIWKINCGIDQVVFFITLYKYDSCSNIKVGKRYFRLDFY